MLILVEGDGEVAIPLPGSVKLKGAGLSFENGKKVKHTIAGGYLKFEVDGSTSGKMLVLK